MDKVLPWYKALEDTLGRSEFLVNAMLVGIVVITVVLLLFVRSRTLNLAWLVYLVSP